MGKEAVKFRRRCHCTVLRQELDKLFSQPAMTKRNAAMKVHPTDVQDA
jgi:hypothetical protein